MLKPSGSGIISSVSLVLVESNGMMLQTWRKPIELNSFYLALADGPQFSGSRSPTCHSAYTGVNGSPNCTFRWHPISDFFRNNFDDWNAGIVFVALMCAVFQISKIGRNTEVTRKLKVNRNKGVLKNKLGGPMLLDYFLILGNFRFSGKAVQMLWEKCKGLERR